MNLVLDDGKETVRGEKSATGVRFMVPRYMRELGADVLPPAQMIKETSRRDPSALLSPEEPFWFSSAPSTAAKRLPTLSPKLRRTERIS